LYDRVFEAATRYARWCEHHTRPPADEINLTGRPPPTLTKVEQQILDLVDEAVVYDINDVVPLLGDWERDKDKAVPRQPPHEITWVEWSETAAKPAEDGHTLYVDSAVGALITPAHPIMKLSDFCEGLRDMEERQGQLYATTVFRHITDTNFPHLSSLRGQIVVDDGLWAFSLLNHGTDIEEYYLYGDRGDLQPDSMLGFEIPVPLDRTKMWIGLPWQPFCAFALLHCKNIVTEDHEPDERIQRRCAQHGNPPRVTYKTLKVEVPKTVHARRQHEATGEGSKKCFHLCSGHFKHLQAERYHNPGWVWWPAHFRGDPDLGTVDKQYRLVPKREETP
jgi:hypothetical protein